MKLVSDPMKELDYGSISIISQRFSVLEHGEKYESEPWSNMKKVIAFKVDLM